MSTLLCCYIETSFNSQNKKREEKIEGRSIAYVSVDQRKSHRHVRSMGNPSYEATPECLSQDEHEKLHEKCLEYPCVSLHQQRRTQGQRSAPSLTENMKEEKIESQYPRNY